MCIRIHVFITDKIWINKNVDCKTKGTLIVAVAEKQELLLSQLVQYPYINGSENENTK